MKGRVLDDTSFFFARRGLMGCLSPSACRPIYRIFEWCVVAAIAVRLAALLMPGPDFDRTHRYPPTITNVGTDTAELAGEYHKGIGRGGGWELSVLPDARYSVFLGMCTGTGHRESGYVRRAGDCYVLSPTEPCEGSMDRVFLSVRWENRSYRIPPDSMEQFCDAIIQGDEPRNDIGGAYYLRYPAPKADGIPELPKQWADYLDQHLVMGEIVEVMDDGRVRVDMGKAKGIEPESVLAVQGRDRYGARRLVVVSIDDESCIAVDPDPERSSAPLEVGMHLVTQR